MKKKSLARARLSNEHLKDLGGALNEIKGLVLENPACYEQAISSLDQIADECRKKVRAGTWKIWLTCEVFGKNERFMGAPDFLAEFRSCGMFVGEWSYELLLRSVRFASLRIGDRFPLVIVSNLDLGFQVSVSRQTTYKEAGSYGLYCPPAALAPFVRLQYSRQPEDEWLLFGSEPITDSHGDLKIFRLGRGNIGMWLDDRHGSPEHCWEPKSQWIFWKPE